MKTVYEAANSLDAHMVQHLLAQEGIAAEVFGTHLQGGAGELPAGGLVRVVADEADWARARGVIEDWERAQPPDAQTLPRKTTAGQSGVAAFLAGAALTALIAWALVHSPVYRDGTDYDGDGKYDETWIVSPRNLPLRQEVDRNFDGRLDYITHFDARGRIERAEADDDFDGDFDATLRFVDGNVSRIERDSDGNGIVDRREHYRHGVLVRIEYVDPVGARVFRIEHWAQGRLERAERDLDGDGQMDEGLFFAADGELARREPLAR